MIAMAFWESSVEGRNAWDKKKLGWKLKIGKYVITSRYHFWVWAMFAFLLALPLIVSGWNLQLFGILISAVASGAALEDFMWYVVNPAVKFKEWYSHFSDYYPWIRIGKIKIIPLGYAKGILIALLSWYFIWR